MANIHFLLRIILIPILVFAQSLSVSGQFDPGKIVRVGEKVPDLPLKMINYKDSTAHLSDFKAKLLILDFWSTFCSSCIAEFPKMAALQTKYKGSISILPVTNYMNRAFNVKFLKTQKEIGRPMLLPSAVEASDLRNMFPTYGFPTEVWIDSTGTVIGVTDQFPVTDSVIGAYLSGKTVHLPRVLYDLGYNMDKPLLVDNNGGDDSMYFCRSLLTRYNPDIPGTSNTPTIVRRNGIKISERNSRLLEMLQVALCYSDDELHEIINALSVKSKRMIIEKSDEYSLGVNMENYLDSEFVAFERFEQDNLWCYELDLPPGYTVKEAYKYMLEDLERYFHLSLRVDTPVVKYWALIRDSTAMRQKQGVTAVERYETSSHRVSAKGAWLTNGDLAGVISQIEKFPLILDETGQKGRFNFDLEFSSDNDLTSLNEKLSAYGLRLKPSEKAMKMIYVTRTK